MFLLCFGNLYTYGQTTRNFGKAEIHGNAKIGFYSSVQNDGMLTGNSGLVGLYGNTPFSFSGSFIPHLYDLEIAHEESVFLNVPIEVDNNINFIYGNITTDRNTPTDYLDLSANSFYEGASDFSKVDGFIQSTFTGDYIFPVGDAFYLRPLAASTTENSVLKCAYFFDNPNISISDNYSASVLAINPNEFWELYGEPQIEITIGWDERSLISELTSDLSNLTIVGYDKEKQEWVDLGSIETNGTTATGFITSGQFVPNEYQAFTFGLVENSGIKKSIINAGRYLVTPNGDGINDFLHIPDLENYESNLVQIFNRYGRKVFELENYKDEFIGIYNLNALTINKNYGLPEGVYFYVVNLTAEKIRLQGYLYLTR